MYNNKISYLRGIIIVHGKSELQMCSYIKQNLRLKIEIVADKKLLLSHSNFRITE